jgi:hypothetical protein
MQLATNECTDVCMKGPTIGNRAMLQGLMFGNDSVHLPKAMYNNAGTSWLALQECGTSTL